MANNAMPAAARPTTTVDSPIAPDSDSQCTVYDALRDTQSLSDSITNYPIYWGRRYHRYREGAYHYPNDEPEMERLDAQHAILLHYFDGRLFFSPLDPENTLRVIDIGTGTGVWPIDLAESGFLPKANITGIDLSAIQPDLVPAQVSFEIQDVSDSDWCRPFASLDFIHSRFMAGSLTSYRSLIDTARRYLRPDSGWLEIQEVHPTPVCDDGTMPNDWKFLEWEKNLNHAAKHCIDPPRPIRVASNLRQWMKEAGYVDVHEHIYKIPLGSWPKNRKLKEVGRHYGENWMAGLPGFSYRLFGAEGMGWSRNEIELHLAEVRSSFAKKGVHAYLRLFVVYGRRPSKAEDMRSGRMG